MTIGDLELVPEFDPELLEYAVATTNNSNKVTAVTDDPSAIIAIELENSDFEEGKEIENGKSVIWASGENIITITVTDGEGDDKEATVYVVTVTKS